MTHIAFHTSHIPWPYERQVPTGMSVAINPGSDAGCDLLVVYDDIKGVLETSVPLARRVLFIAEPPSIRSYPTRYLNQFGTIVCPYVLNGFKGNQIKTQTSLPWHFDVNRAAGNSYRHDFVELESLLMPHKADKISVVCSNKAFTAGHRQRLAFVERAKQEFGERLEVFGRGFREIDDKADVILPFKFHLVLENNTTPHFWTEKLADAYLGYAYPIFNGCSNIHDYFDVDSLTKIDINQPEQALATMRYILETPGFYDSRLSSVQKARHDVMYRYNLFAVIETIAADSKPAEKLPKPSRLKASAAYEPLHQILYRKLSSLLYKVAKRILGGRKP